jgi:hypothetical protein
MMTSTRTLTLRMAGGYDIIDLMESNRKLIAFLSKQSTTIARLRVRIVRMRDLISILNANIDRETRDAICMQHGNLWNATKVEQDDELATVLMDIAEDTSFLVQPNQNPKMILDLLPNPKVVKEIKRKLETFSANKGNEPELWIYFDSGASRSVISTTSPVRKHLKSITRKWNTPPVH